MLSPLLCAGPHGAAWLYLLSHSVMASFLTVFSLDPIHRPLSQPKQAVEEEGPHNCAHGMEFLCVQKPLI